MKFTQNTASTLSFIGAALGLFFAVTHTWMLSAVAFGIAWVAACLWAFLKRP